MKELFVVVVSNFKASNFSVHHYPKTKIIVCEHFNHLDEIFLFANPKLVQSCPSVVIRNVLMKMC